MTQGTSVHSESLSRGWAGEGHNQADFLSGWRRAARGWAPDALGAAAAAPTQLAAASAIAGLVLGATLTATWQAWADAGTDGAARAQLALLLAVGAIVALVVLRPDDPAPARAVRRQLDAPMDPSRLLAQMQHELRTPLNAMIGFSEVMLHEFHGPLGHARYQEYAAHISESGGRLLKASEDALAVAATMSVLAADRRARRRERLMAAGLVQGAWAALGVRPEGVRLRVESEECVEIACDGPTTLQALQHVLAEAVARTPRDGVVVAEVRRVGGRGCIEIAAAPAEPGRDHLAAAHGHRRADANIATDGGMRLLLANALFEMQGAGLSLCTDPRTGMWSTRIIFSGARPTPPGRDPAGLSY